MTRVKKEEEVRVDLSLGGAIEAGQVQVDASDHPRETAPEHDRERQLRFRVWGLGLGLGVGLGV